MKPVNFILSLILILLIAFGAFFYTGGTLKAQVSALSASAADYPEALDAVLGVLSSGSAPQRFTDELPSDGSGLYLLDVNIQLTNRGIFPAEWLNIRVQPADGDIAVYSLTGDGSDVAARSAGQVNLKLVTRAPEGAARSATIQYYVYGVSRTIEVSF